MLAVAGFENHYKTLGLPHFADAAAIKAAYRKLAKQTHPDANGGDDSKFKDINAAYAVLTHPEKKAAFDKKLEAIIQRADAINPHKQAAKQKQTAPPASSQSQQHAHKQASQQANQQSPAPSSDVVDRFFHRFLKEPLKNVGKQGGPATWFRSSPHKENSASSSRYQHAGIDPIRGEDVSVETTLPLAQATKGTTKTVHVKHREPCPKCLTTGKVDDKRCPTCLSEGYVIRKRSIEVKIPAGVQHGAKIRVSGEGGRSPNGGDNGDLYLVVQLSPPPSGKEKHPDSKSTDAPQPPKSEHSNTTASTQNESQQLDTHSDLTLSCWDALMGTQRPIQTEQGPVTLTVPAQTGSGKRLRLKGMGRHKGNQHGDHWVTIQVAMPDTLTEEQKALIRRWQQEQ